MHPLATLNEMFSEMDKAPQAVQPSKFWRTLNEEHLKALDLDTFKQTLAKQYFTFFLRFGDPQIKFLHAHVKKHLIVLSFIKTLFSSKFAHESKKRSLSYTYLTQLLWEYISATLPPHLLNIEEPLVGSPLLVKWRGRQITQDLANSLLEFHSIISHVKEKSIHTVLELGAGYGRLGHVFLTHLPHVKYIIADIPPALCVAQSYLERVFSGKKVFPFRPFECYEDIREEFETASICFLLPHQLELLPEKSIDLGVNISSLHEMTLESNHYYFSQFSRLIAKCFYFKQWKESFNPHDHLMIRETDYPIPDTWKEIFWHTCPVQTRFFEALFTSGTLR